MTTNILKDINSSYIYEIATNLKPLINKDITSDIINSIKNKINSSYSKSNYSQGQKKQMFFCVSYLKFFNFTAFFHINPILAFR